MIKSGSNEVLVSCKDQINLMEKGVAQKADTSTFVSINMRIKQSSLV